MPGVTGLDLQNHLHRMGIAIPTIIITAYNEIGLREKCIAAGASSFLVKPIDSEILIDAINCASIQLKGHECSSEGTP
jgi:FixJ family two-component response regulator